MYRRFDMARFDLNLLVALNALLSEKSVTRAAASIHVSQPTMSGMLARLREQLGDALLVKVGDRLELTSRAIDLSPRVRQLMLSVDDLARPAPPFNPAEADRRFRIMASDYGLQFVLPKVFHQAAEHAPSIRFLILPVSSPVDRVFDGLVDIAITGDPMTDLSLERGELINTQVLLDEDYVGLVGARSAISGPMPLATYLSARRATVMFDLQPCTVEQLAIGTTEDLAPSVVAPSFSALAPLLEGGQTVALIPRRMAEHMVKGHGLRTVALGFECHRPHLRTLWHARHRSDPAHIWLRTLIVAAASSLTGREDLDAAS